MIGGVDKKTSLASHDWSDSKVNVWFFLGKERKTKNQIKDERYQPIIRYSRGSEYWESWSESN